MSRTLRLFSISYAVGLIRREATDAVLDTLVQTNQLAWSGSNGTQRVYEKSDVTMQSCKARWSSAVFKQLYSNRLTRELGTWITKDCGSLK